VTLILDTAPVVAMHDRNDPWQSPVEALLRSEPGELVIPAPVSAEIDYLLGERLGEPARLAFLEDVAAGRYRVACLEPQDYGPLARLERRYSSITPRLADLSVVVLAARYETDRIVTFDRRDFTTLRRLDTGGRFTLLPS